MDGKEAKSLKAQVIREYREELERISEIKATIKKLRAKALENKSRKLRAVHTLYGPQIGMKHNVRHGGLAGAVRSYIGAIEAGKTFTSVGVFKAVAKELPHVSNRSISACLSVIKKKGDLNFTVHDDSGGKKALITYKKL